MPSNIEQNKKKNSKKAHRKNHKLEREFVQFFLAHLLKQCMCIVYAWIKLHNETKKNERKTKENEQTNERALAMYLCWLLHQVHAHIYEKNSSG